jgi:probable O-glycosylation ligase (exosortase A-associated)
MRDIVFTLFVLGGLLATLRFPYVGMLMWVGFSIMNPHEATYGFARSLPWNLIIAIVTILSWLASGERKTPPAGMTTAVVLALLAWTTFNTFFAFDPSWSWHFWNRAWKTIAMCVLAGTLTVNRARFHALTWTVALSLGYFGIKGGFFTLLTGGHNRVFGPPDSMLADNNQLGLGLVIVLPILNYLRLHSGVRLIRIGILGTIVLTLAAILGTYSRGAYVALAVLAVAFWLRAKNKFLYPVVAVAAIVPLVMFMPPSFYQRAASIQQYDTDASFQGRLESWRVAFHYAMDHAPFGAGFYGMNLPAVWNLYRPGELHAIHSIYFQVLGEQGVIGLALYLLVILIGFVNFSAVRRRLRGNPKLLWAYDLASMMQLSLLAFCVGGAAAPMDFFDLLFLWVLLSAALLEQSEQRQPQRENLAEILRSVHQRAITTE